MKKFLSILLAVVMILPMLPTAFAEGETTQFVYNINNTVFNDENNGVKLSVGELKTNITSYEQFNSTEQKWLVNNYDHFGASNIIGTRMQIADNTTYIKNNRVWIAFKLQKPTVGIYNIDTYVAHYTYGASADVYVFPCGDITTVTASNFINRTPLGHFDTMEEGAKDGNYYEKNIGKMYFDGESDYYFVIKFVDNGKAGDPEKDRQQIYLEKIVLTEIPVSSMAFDKESLSIAKGDAIVVSAIAKDVNGEELSEAVITYESENPAVATVDATTGKVTGVGDGTTNIIAKVAGYEITAKIPVTVRDYTHKYIFGSSVFTEDTKTYLGDNLANGTTLRTLSMIADDYKYVDENLTDLWAFSSLGSTSGNIVGDKFNMGIKLTNVGYDSPASRVVLKLKVRYPGVYDLGIGSGTISSRALCADIYMISADGVSSLSNEIIRSNKKLGTIDALVGSSADDILGTINLEAGDYYLVFDLWNDMVVGDDKHNIYPMSAKLTLHEGDIVEEDDSVALESKKLSFSLGSTDNAEVKVNGDLHSGNTVYKLDRSEEITVEAGEAPEGKRFKAWVQGTAENGIWKSSDAKYTFNIMTHTYLTAVYEAVPADDAYVVEYYNENGKYITTKEATGTTPVLPDPPGLTGHRFAMWTLDGKTKFDENSILTQKLTQAVAKYDASEITPNNFVKYNGVDKTAAFGTPILVSDAKATHWLRDGRVVAYGSEYTHYIWDGTSIYCSYAEIEKKPLVIIEDTLVDSAVMIEYDEGNKSIVEVGILFGSTAAVDINSCNSKATSQRNSDHGQFTALPGDAEGFARGYLIYDDGGAFKVIYTDAIEINE